MEEIINAPQYDQLFVDNFDEGTSNYSNWTIYEEAGNLLLDGNSHAWATLINGENWRDYDYSLDV